MATGWLVTLLERVAAQDTRPPAPAETRVVQMPRDANKLIDAIRKTSNELVQAQTKRGQIAMAWQELEREHAELLESNQREQEEIIARLKALQGQLVDIAKECGIKAEVVHVTIGG